MKRALWALCAGLAFLLLGCANPTEPFSRDPGAEALHSPEAVSVVRHGEASATLKLFLTDFPLQRRKVEAVWIDIRRVEVHGDSTGWRVLAIEAQKHDLLRLVDDVAQLGLAELPPDRYTQIRLILGSGNTIVTEDDGERPLSVPSGEKTGIKIHCPFLAKRGSVIRIVLDFDAQRSVRLTGRGSYKLIPALRIKEVTYESPGGDNSPPTASFPDWSYEAQGAGTAAVNGHYFPAGTFNGKDQYAHASGAYYLFNFWASDDWMRHWGINPGPANYVALADVGYHAADALAPPETGWQVGTGGTPAPTLLRMPISGDLSTVGAVLTGHYLYSDPDGDAEGASTYQWFRGTAAEPGTAIPGATGLSYTTVAADDGAYLRFQVTPVDSLGLAGSAIMSSAVAIGAGS